MQAEKPEFVPQNPWSHVVVWTWNPELGTQDSWVLLTIQPSLICKIQAIERPSIKEQGRYPPMKTSKVYSISPHLAEAKHKEGKQQDINKIPHSFLKYSVSLIIRET